MRFRRSILLPAVLVSVLAGGVSIAVASGPRAFASTSLHDVLSALRRNSKVSERLNAGFFRAPQTQGYTGSAFRPTDGGTAFAVSTSDGSLSLEPTQLTVTPSGTTTTTTTTTTSSSTTTTGTVTSVPQTSGTFEAPLEIPNRAKVVKVQASYNDSAGNNSGQTTSGFNFEVVRYGLNGDSPTELLSQPGGVRSTDGRKTTATLPLANSGFQVNNSTSRYVLRVTITDTNAATKLYGFSIQYVIGKGVPGAPA